jgi:hypothetical protein
MRSVRRVVVSVAALFVVPLLLAAVDEPKKKAKKPSLSLRATPRMAYSPVTVYYTAELTGGDEVEDFYCPELEWEWGDGGKSVQESDCAPFEAGVTKLQRRFTAEHTFRLSGNYNTTVRLLRAGRSISKADVNVMVRAGLGEPPRRNYPDGG